MPGNTASTRDLKRVGPPRVGLAVLSGSLALNVLALAMPLVMLQIFDRIIPYAAQATLSVFLLGLLSVALAEFCLRLARIALVGHVGAKFEKDLSDQTYDHMLRSIPRNHEKDQVGVHFERFGAIAQLREHYAGQGRLLILDLPFTALFIVMISLIGGWLALVPISILLVIVIVATLAKIWQSRALEQRKTLDGRRYSFLIEFLSQIATVKSNRMEPQMLRRYEMLTTQSISASRTIIRLSGVSQSFGALLGQGAVAAMGLLGAFLVIHGSIGVGELAACMLLNGRTTQPLLKLLGVMMQSESTSQARQKIEELRAVPVRRKPSSQPELKGHISLRGLGFRHPQSGTPVFEGLQDDISSGEAVLLDGADGAGRTSLMRMIMAEQAPSEGTIRIGGIPPALVAGRRGLNGIVHLDQMPVVFRGTVLENITLFGLVGGRSAALETSRRLGLEAEIRSLPYGYQTVLGADAGPYSHGFLQLVCLTRALNLSPRILLFNNASSAMDHETAELAATELARRTGSCTMLIVSNQPGIRAIASRSLHLRCKTQAQRFAAWDEDLAHDQRTTDLLNRKTA